MSNQVSLAMKTLKVKDNKVDAKSSLWNMLGSCKTVFCFFFTHGSSIILREGKKLKMPVLRIFHNPPVLTDSAQHEKPWSQQFPLGRLTPGRRTSHA